MKPVVVIGDALLDRDVDGTANRLCPDAPAPVISDAASRSRPGGAALAAALARLDGVPVVLMTAVARDDAGRALLAHLEQADVEVHDLGCESPTPEKVRVCAEGRPLVRIDRGGSRSTGLGGLSPAGRRLLDAAAVVLVSDYGRGLAEHRDIRLALARCRDDREVVWDPHPRGPAPVPGVRIATPNLAELEAATPDVVGDGPAVIERRAALLQRRWGTSALAVTLGSRGALLTHGSGLPLMVPVTSVARGDSCGAGDRFAATMATSLVRGALPSEAVIAAVQAATRFVRDGGASSYTVGRLRRGRRGLRHSPAASAPGSEGRCASDVAQEVRAAGGTVVATGGCFDLLHSGHLKLLESARRLGDCLIVLLNSDTSIRRLKGAGRPLIVEDERRQLVAALACVDAVEVFDEDTPIAALERLHPDIWVKGGDYSGQSVPEAAVVAKWNGHAVSVPYVKGRSTTSLLKEVMRRGVA